VVVAAELLRLFTIQQLSTGSAAQFSLLFHRGGSVYRSVYRSDFGKFREFFADFVRLSGVFIDIDGRTRYILN
jgi:hypothetical protein